jgi:hypothetical protein
VAFTYDQWRYVFTNTFDEADARAAYDRYHVPAGGIFWDSVLANFIPGPQYAVALARLFPKPSLLNDPRPLPLRASRHATRRRGYTALSAMPGTILHPRQPDGTER